MEIIGFFLSALWILFGIVWIGSAMIAKKSVRNAALSTGIVFRALFVILVLVFFQTSAFQDASLRFNHDPNIVVSIVGICLCALGIGLAIWARIYLGKNWGMPMTLKEHPELVTSGPYTFVRHPIYTGMLLAMIGSALVDGLSWLIFFILFCAYFIYSARKEEKNMAKQFPDEYPAYMKKSKMLIPFVF